MPVLDAAPAELHPLLGAAWRSAASRGRDPADRVAEPALVVGILDARDDRRALGLPRPDDLLVLVERALRPPT